MRAETTDNNLFPSGSALTKLRTANFAPLSATSIISLAIGLGLIAGYVDVGILIFKRYFWNSEGYFRNASDFPWMVPLGHASLMLLVGVMVAVVGRRWRWLVTLRTSTWLFAALSLWMALLRLPLYGQCSVFLAIGMGRVIGDGMAAYGNSARFRWRLLGGVVGVLCVLAAGTSGLQLIREYRTVGGLGAAPANAHNVVLIVWDTVRAYNLSLYGYSRRTTPHLERWAKQGVKYDLAVSPAPWTYPSHSSFFTGQWPFRLDSQWKFKLDTPSPTLAEYLTTKGYQTAGFVANTNCCSYETRLNRGFAHFADYELSPRSLLTRTVAGKWLLDKVLSMGFSINPRWANERKWAALQSRGAGEITDEFLGWLGRRRPDRPFFAYLNYFDAHEPYIPPPDFSKTFGIAAQSARDVEFLFDYIGVASTATPDRDLVMARDNYDDCIASLDAELGRLFDDLRRQGLLQNTVIIITSDHGEAFAMHGGVGHSFTVYLEETGVPLVILAPNAPAGRALKQPVSLRDLPATVVDLLGMSASSPFQGRSLAAFWKHAAGEMSTGSVSAAFSEQASEMAFQRESASGREHTGVEMSVAASGYHYIRDGRGHERLYNLAIDPYEQLNLSGSTPEQAKLMECRKMLLDVLSSQPGSATVEKAYLASYRSWLEELVGARPARSLALADE
jgi:arylsulfatase A-like enzyme